MLDEMEKPEFLPHVAKVGAYFQDQLGALREKYSRLITEVRGRGLMLGAQLARPGRDVVNDCLARGAIINCTAGDVLRFVPPLIVTEEQVDEMIAILDKVLSLLS